MEYHYLFYLSIVFLALYLSITITNRLIKLSVTPVKYPEIDGLRGYLAFFVFLHHSYIWSHYLKTNQWEEPESNLFNQFGQTSVTLFFIITAFLFINKLIDKKKVNFDWNKYIIARFFRMFPMYFFSVCFVLFIVAIESNFQLKEPLIDVVKNSLSWILFAIKGSININSLENTFQINSGVSWSLPYEWMFYFLLPIFAIILKVKVNYKVVESFIVVFLIILYINQSSLKKFIPFLGGIFSAFLIKNTNCSNLKEIKFTFIGLILAFISIYYFNSGRAVIPIIISTFLFIMIASGNSFFGILSTDFSRKFGQITYSIYLIHGIVLFIIFRYIIGYEEASKLSELGYWGIIAISVFPVIFLSQITYKLIELPLMNINKNKQS
jgi:peptidoglycan/LPS O-acetylase OafA/YrhL